MVIITGGGVFRPEFWTVDPGDSSNHHWANQSHNDGPKIKDNFLPDPMGIFGLFPPCGDSKQPQPPSGCYGCVPAFEASESLDCRYLKPHCARPLFAGKHVPSLGLPLMFTTPYLNLKCIIWPGSRPMLERSSQRPSGWHRTSTLGSAPEPTACRTLIFDESQPHCIGKH